MSVRRLAVLAVLTTIIFVQEELLMWIPNVQLTFMLIILYTTTLHFSEAIMIMLVHVLLDNLFMSSFNIQVMLPMAVGYFITIILAYIFKNKNEYILAAVGVVGSVAYAISFALFNILFFDIELIPYLIADIPFTITLAMSTALSVLFLYKPLRRVLMDGLNGFKSLKA